MSRCCDAAMLRNYNIAISQCCSPAISRCHNVVKRRTNAELRTQKMKNLNKNPRKRKSEIKTECGNAEMRAN